MSLFGDEGLNFLSATFLCTFIFWCFNVPTIFYSFLLCTGIFRCWFVFNIFVICFLILQKIMNNSTSSSFGSSSDGSVVQDNVAIELSPIQTIKFPKIFDLPARHDKALEFLFSKDMLTWSEDITYLSCERTGMHWKIKAKTIVSC